MVENKFWLVKSLRHEEYELYNKVPHVEYSGVFTDWYSTHDHCYLSKTTAERFSDIKSSSAPVAVRLVRTDSDTPDFYVQRYLDCLFINNRLDKVLVPRKRKFFGYKWVEVEEVPHVYRISNKLFPEITEKSGIVKFNIERLKEEQL